ncbi:MAG: 4-hydroxyphenylacetate 3-hydroxylase N-terminal domain-containing protein [Dehalococcoidales bacterium]|nr:4-hydroxyphenylacetate 3-hydroxylase N-terminal domain-containing protein [Dehalococcoidales bacterium]
MITSQEYKKRLMKLRRNVYMDGQLISRDDPRLEGAANCIAKTYDVMSDPDFKDYEDILTATSHLTGKKISRFCHIHQSITDLLAKQKATRLVSHQVGGCIQRCMGIDSTNANSVASWEADQKYGTEYNKRFLNWLRDFQENDRSACCAQTDVKGNRPQRPGEQLDPDVYVHRVETLSDGIVIRGAKVHNSNSSVVEWIPVIPTRRLVEDEKDWAVSCMVPADDPNVKLVVSATRFGGHKDLGQPGPYGTADSLTVFDNVFVPWEHVFLNGEYDIGGRLALLFALYHRHSYTGCKPAMTDVLMGAVALMAECNGIEGKSHVQERLADMICTSELCYGTGIAAGINGTRSGSGTFIPDIVFCNASRRHAGMNIYHEFDALADVAGGMPATLPLEGDWLSEETKKFVEKYMTRNPKVSAEDQHRAFRWVQDISCSEFAGVSQYAGVHGGGSPRMEQIAILNSYDVERVKNIAKRLAGIPVKEKYTFDRLGKMPVK